MPFGLGVTHSGNGQGHFLVWAPFCDKVEVGLFDNGSVARWLPMQKRDRGYFYLLVDNVEPGMLYTYRLNGNKERPDPASRVQPQGVHGPSQVVTSKFDWQDQSWFGLPLQAYIIYEVHVGTFTDEGTFAAIVPRLRQLKALGVSAIELMPVAQFPGSRNWGYDGAFPFAAQESYGGPEGLKQLVNACHREGLAIILDVVYNHLGPEGNYLADFGPYFTKRYRTPWGDAINFDGPHSDEVRRFFIENALHWITEFHFDALRLDAVHAIVDHTAQPFLQELADAVHVRAEALRRRIHLIAESSLNDARLVQPKELGGCGLDAQWNDDFHHSLHGLLTGERASYYEDFGEVRHMVKALSQGFVYDGQYSAFRKRRHGKSSLEIPAHCLVVCSQNHDQVGNRALGERLSRLTSFRGLKLAAGMTLLSPYIPLLFMGEEYGETAPFLYFISHGDAQLVEAVRQGRRAEFSSLSSEQLPDPQAKATFEQSRLNPQLFREGWHLQLLKFYQELIRLRKELSPLKSLKKEKLEVVGFENERVLYFRRWSGTAQCFLVFSFGDKPVEVQLPVPKGHWIKVLDSEDGPWRSEPSTATALSSSMPSSILSTGGSTVALDAKVLALFTLKES